LGLTALAQGDITRAQAFIYQSLDLFTGFVTGWDIAQSLVYLGEAIATAGNWLEAKRTFLDALHLAKRAQAISLAVDALVGLAGLKARAGEAEQALALSLCILSHPASTHAAKDHVEHLRAQLETQLTEQQVKAIQAWVQTKPFDTLVAEVLNDSRSPL
jgi:hypothetical protein